MDRFLAIPEEDRVDIFSITFEKFETGLAKAMDRAKMSFFEVGYWLYQAHNSTDFIYNNGYENIADYAYQKFGLTKSTTYDLMKVYRRFCDESGYALAPEYIRLSQSQLVALSRMKYTQKDFLSKVKPTDTVSDVEKAVKIYNYKTSHGGGSGSFSDIKEYIEKYEPLMEKEKAEVAENSRRLENATKQPIKETTPEIPEAPQKPQEAEEAEVEAESNEKISAFLIPACETMLKHMCYKTIFDPDNKGHGVKVLPDTLSEQMVQEMLKAFVDNRTAIKNKIKSYVLERLGKYDYEINLNGRKQPFSQFCGNIANCIMDIFTDEWDGLRPKEKKKVKKKESS